MDSVAAQIHEASLQLLLDPGVRIESEEALKLLLSRGAKPGAAAQVARFPPEMVRDCLALCPKEFALTDRRGREMVLTPSSEPIFWSCPGLFLSRGGEHRPFTTRDMAESSRLLERLENVQAVFGMALDDVPPHARDAAGLAVMARNSSKHLRALCFSAQGADALVEMKQVVGAHPWFSVGFTAHGPLRWTRLALEIFRRTAGHGIPVSVNGEPMAGVSGPVTLAGAAAVGNAEILAGLIVNQLLEPGRACLYNLGLAHVFDMRTALVVTGGPENALFARLSAALGRFYNLPSASWVSTESMVPDGQAALEKMFGFHTHMESGVSCIWGVGQLESEMTFSPEQAVLDNEMISFARRYRRGCEATAESLALEATREVGIAGSFLDHEHTLKHFREALFMPRLLFRDRRAAWDAGGRKRLDERAAEVAAELSRQPVETHLSADQTRALDRIAERLQRSPPAV
jgi:trimethylamine--corrinoid protein Co-methyltransferase